MHFNKILLMAIVAESHAQANTAQQTETMEPVTSTNSNTEITSNTFPTVNSAIGLMSITALLAVPATVFGIIISGAISKKSKTTDAGNVLPVVNSVSIAVPTSEHSQGEALNTLSSLYNINRPHIPKDSYRAYRIDKITGEQAKRNVDKRLPPRNPKAWFQPRYGSRKYLDYHNHPEHTKWEEHKPLQTFYKWLEDNIDVKDHIGDFPSQVKYTENAYNWITEHPTDQKLILNFERHQRELRKGPMLRPALDMRFVYELAHVIHKIIIVHGVINDGKKFGITASCRDGDFDYAANSEPIRGETYNDGYFEELFEFARGNCQRLLHLIWFDDRFDEIRNLREKGVIGYTLEFGSDMDPLSYGSFGPGITTGSPQVWGPIAVASAKGFEGTLYIRRRYDLDERSKVDALLKDMQTVASANTLETADRPNLFTVDFLAKVGTVNISSIQEFEQILAKGQDQSMLDKTMEIAELGFTFADVLAQHHSSTDP